MKRYSGEGQHRRNEEWARTGGGSGDGGMEIDLSKTKMEKPYITQGIHHIRNHGNATK